MTRGGGDLGGMKVFGHWGRLSVESNHALRVRSPAVSAHSLDRRRRVTIPAGVEPASTGRQPAILPLNDGTNPTLNQQTKQCQSRSRTGSCRVKSDRPTVRLTGHRTSPKTCP